MRPGASFRKPTRTKTGQLINLMNCLMHRDGPFTDADVDTFSRCYGMPQDKVRGLIAEEMQRRAEREARRGAA